MHRSRRATSLYGLLLMHPFALACDGLLLFCLLDGNFGGGGTTLRTSFDLVFEKIVAELG